MIKTEIANTSKYVNELSVICFYHSHSYNCCLHYTMLCFVY